MIWLVPLLPASAGVVIWAALGGRGRAALAWAGTGAVLGTLALASLAAAAEASGAWRWGAGLELTLGAAGLSRVMAMLVPAIAAPVVAYAAYHEPEHGLARLVGLLAAFVGTMELLVLAGDLLTLLVGWELVGLLSWALIGFEWRERAATDAAAQAFLPTRFGELGLFLAAGAAFTGAGSLRFDALGDLGGLGGTRLDVVAAGVLVAAVAKSGQVPFSPWLFSAMAGPTPVSALLHSATMVAAGAYALARLQPVLGAVSWFGPAVVAVGLVTAIAGGLLALVQDHAKRVLAASTSAQYGLMFVAVGAGYPGAAGAHLVTQAFFKALLFLTAGVAMQAAATGDIRAMRLGRALPRVALLAAVGSLALAALPPLGAAWSKEAIVGAAFEEGPLVGAGVLLAGLLSAAYATRLQLLAFGRGAPPPAGVGTAPAVALRPSGIEVGAVAALAAGTVLLSALWLPGSAARVADLTGGAVPEEALAIAAAGVAGVAAGYLAGRLLTRRPVAVPPMLAEWFGIPAATRRLVVDPSLAAARGLAAFDARVVDAGVRGAGWIGDHIGAVFARRDTLTVDAIVEAIGRAGVRAGLGSAAADDRGVDGAVERTADGVGTLGRLARRVQTGMAHHYLMLVAGGLLALGLLARAWR